MSEAPQYPSDPRAEERIGCVLHEKWTLERLIGVGGMGAVYSARHRNGARAAVKVLSPAAACQQGLRNRFLREGYAANRVEHPNAVKVLDDDVIEEGPDAGTAYLVMELLTGESLQERIKREPPLDERELLEIADGVLSVLEAAHAHGVVHRDLKPDNLFLAKHPEREGESIVKVLDFGLARLLDAQEQTFAGIAIGTPTYMSPEQAAGHVDEIDGRTDIYALGSILFQLSSHRRIHDAAHTLGLVVRMATTPAPKLASIAPDASESFARIVDRALEFKREDRYQTAAEMRRDVEAALSGLTSNAAVTTEEVTRSEVTDAPSAKRAGRWMKPALVAGAALVLGVVVWKSRDAASSSAPQQEVTTNLTAGSASVTTPADTAPDAEVAAVTEFTVDASAIDGGEDEDDEDDDEDVIDAALPSEPPASFVEPSKPAVGASAGTAGGQRQPSAKPPKAVVHRASGQPRKKKIKKKRWHW